MNRIIEDVLMHYGMPRRSGRYPWGSGDNPYQHEDFFLARIKELSDSGMSEKEIAESMGLTTSQLRTQKSLAKAEQRRVKVETAKALRAKGYSLDKIAEKMGFSNDSSVRSLLNENSEARMNVAQKTADFLKKQVDKKGMIQVGTGTELELPCGRISKERLKEALYILELQGYNTFGGGVPQVTNKGKQTNIKVLCPPDTPYKVDPETGKKTSSAIYDFENIHTINDYVTKDGGDTFEKRFVYPKSMDPSRVMVRYAEDGGKDMDGLVEIRRGVDDLSLGESRYAQVRILVDGTHYIKGMATYADNYGHTMPKGVDVIFNTNKAKGVPMMVDDPDAKQVLKPISKKDPDNPFGSLIKEGIVDPDNPGSKGGGQSYYYDKDGKKQLSLINKRAEEGDWGEWSKTLPSQFLSKQKKELVDRQLNLAIADRNEEFNKILELTNPTVKKALLQSFAEDCDAAAVHLKAAALPRQKYKVIIPIPGLSDKEVYAPDYKNGEKVALVRFPHGGTFEIPILSVNNRHPEAKKALENGIDCVGINSKVAERLSGADFDGDTVMVIPTGGKINITSTPPLKGLVGFDPKLEYGGKPAGSFKPMRNTQNEMGRVSNLITDMTLGGADWDDISKAVRHSMVVIDAEKHGLDYRQSAIDNDIKRLKKTYQGRYDEETGKYKEGAATLISRASAQTSVPKRRGQPWVNPDTGALEWERVNPKTGKFESKYTNETYIDRKGKEKLRTTESTQMAETTDAYRLVSERRTPIELAYAEYANTLKSMANKARKERADTGEIKYSSAAKKAYQREADSLDAKLNLALLNAPRERQAQLAANVEVAAKKKANPDMTTKEEKKIAQQALSRARIRYGAKRTPIELSDREWEAIQAGAISPNKLSQIINHVDKDKLRERATPRPKTQLSLSQVNLIKSMSKSGYSISEIAERLGRSSSTISKYLNE